MSVRSSVVAIGVDPGIAAVGYGLVGMADGKLNLIAHGCIQTESSEPMGKRLGYIFHEIEKLLRQYAPDVGGIEGFIFQKRFIRPSRRGGPWSHKARIRGGADRAHGAYAQCHKKSVTGSARADKNQVQEMVKILLGMPQIPKPDHAADALAAAICTLHSIGPAGYTL